MKKLILLGMLLLFVPLQAEAAPSWTGTANFAFSSTPGDAAIVNWSVYKPTDTGSFSGSSSAYTYQYTLNGWATNPGDPLLEIWAGTSADITNGGIVATGAGLTTTNTISPPAGASSNQGFQLSVIGPGLTTSADTVTAWWTSTVAPTLSVARISSVIVGGSPIGMTSGSIMAPNKGIPPPGVPEPQTWVLLLTMMGFTTWWMRRRQDDDAPLEMTITA